VPSESPALFFDGLAATARSTHTSGGLAVNALHLCPTAPDGHATDAADFGQVLDATVAPLESEQTNEAAAVFLIQPGQDTVDGLMFFGLGTIGMLLTGLAKTAMNDCFLIDFHCCSSRPTIRHR